MTLSLLAMLLFSRVSLGSLPPGPELVRQSRATASVQSKREHTDQPGFLGPTAYLVMHKEKISRDLQSPGAFAGGVIVGCHWAANDRFRLNVGLGAYHYALEGETFSLFQTSSSHELIVPGGDVSVTLFF
jgi:hypothetical protein